VVTLEAVLANSEQYGRVTASFLPATQRVTGKNGGCGGPGEGTGRRIETRGPEAAEIHDIRMPSLQNEPQPGLPGNESVLAVAPIPRKELKKQCRPGAHPDKPKTQTRNPSANNKPPSEPPR
jgi:hypothetical protein